MRYCLLLAFFSFSMSCQWNSLTDHNQLSTLLYTVCRNVITRMLHFQNEAGSEMSYCSLIVISQSTCVGKSSFLNFKNRFFWSHSGLCPPKCHHFIIVSSSYWNFVIITTSTLKLWPQTCLSWSFWGHSDFDLGVKTFHQFTVRPPHGCIIRTGYWTQEMVPVHRTLHCDDVRFINLFSQLKQSFTNIKPPCIKNC